MPQIIVTADRGSGQGEGAVLLRERINSSDFESATFAARLVERLGWAVDDAHAVEQEPPDDQDAPDGLAATAKVPEPEPQTTPA